MEITRNNFVETLPAVKEAIDWCDFLAIDTELTGLYSERSSEHAFDSMEERYAKLRKLCSEFLIIQYGLSCFKYHPKLKKFTHRDFNFYIFPRPHIRQAPDHRFLCQTSSIHFLASHGYDFNKTIYEGISYLRHDQEEKLKEFTNSKYKIQRDSISTPKKESSEANGQKEVEIPDEHKKFIAEINERVNAFIENESETVLKLEPCSGYRRKLIYESVQQKYTSGIEMLSTVNDEKERFITITKMTDNAKIGKLDAKETSDMDDIDTAIGFRKVVEHISQSKKLVLGHHMYLDILHTIHKFFYPLPESLQEYKEMLQLVFPNLIDTKHLASSDRVRPFLENTHLGDLFKSIQGKAFDLPEIETEVKFKGYELSCSNYHEAGFDAFITGVSLIGLTRKIASLQSKNAEQIDASCTFLKPFLNKFYILRHYDIQSLNICGPDSEPDRENVFYVSFPKEWKTIDLVELFLPYGDIYVHWLDDVSALVALKNPENAISAKSGLLNKSSKMYRVQTYADYRKWENQQISTKKVEIKKPATSSSSKVSQAKRSFKNDTSNSSMDLIPEIDENEAEGAPSGNPPAKKLKKSVDDPESGEVTSTFEEDNNW
ncbi:poly(A)-specific ribonuclease PARN isoform X1 [Parasteatoda tepidariorum]|uniref:poly(A)-specific ribonuclease PARN isoform X1 n=1 Tax=Parasteatoda tepidariorum TaxID=114398 RepID=UPI000A2C06F6|nr:poly(A)-specific ribonuclease PARN isoform X2 [Parasteatoda tepidariorum]